MRGKSWIVCLLATIFILFLQAHATDPGAKENMGHMLWFAAGLTVAAWILSIARRDR